MPLSPEEARSILKDTNKNQGTVGSYQQIPSLGAATTTQPKPAGYFDRSTMANDSEGKPRAAQHKAFSRARAHSRLGDSFEAFRQYQAEYQLRSDHDAGHVDAKESARYDMERHRAGHDARLQQRADAQARLQNDTGSDARLFAEQDAARKKAEAAEAAAKAKFPSRPVEPDGFSSLSRAGKRQAQGDLLAAQQAWDKTYLQPARSALMAAESSARAEFESHQSEFPVKLSEAHESVSRAGIVGAQGAEFTALQQQEATTRQQTIDKTKGVGGGTTFAKNLANANRPFR